MTVESGTTSGAFSTLRSLRSVRYRPGQGSMCRITSYRIYRGLSTSRRIHQPK
jgi:hypothetical protein